MGKLLKANHGLAQPPRGTIASSILDLVFDDCKCFSLSYNTVGPIFVFIFFQQKSRVRFLKSLRLHTFHGLKQMLPLCEVDLQKLCCEHEDGHHGQPPTSTPTQTRRLELCNKQTDLNKVRDIESVPPLYMDEN